MPARRRHRGIMRLDAADLHGAEGPPASKNPFADCVPVEPGMPAPPHYQSHYPGKAHLLSQAAAEHQLVFVRCTRCRRNAVYLATDLVKLLHPERNALLPPFPCSKCGRADAIAVECRVAYSDEIGNLTIRRPGPVRLTQLWRTCKLGDP